MVVARGQQLSALLLLTRGHWHGSLWGLLSAEGRVGVLGLSRLPSKATAGDVL